MIPKFQQSIPIPVKFQHRKFMFIVKGIIQVNRHQQYPLGTLTTPVEIDLARQVFVTSFRCPSLALFSCFAEKPEWGGLEAEREREREMQAMSAPRLTFAQAFFLSLSLPFFQDNLFVFCNFTCPVVFKPQSAFVSTNSNSWPKAHKVERKVNKQRLHGCLRHYCTNVPPQLECHCLCDFSLVLWLSLASGS